MALMMGSLYDALIDGGASDEASRKAAEEVANYDARLSTIDSEFKLLKWMVGMNIALTIAVLFKLLA